MSVPKDGRMLCTLYASTKLKQFKFASYIGKHMGRE